MVLKIVENEKSVAFVDASVVKEYSGGTDLNGKEYLIYSTNGDVYTLITEDDIMDEISSKINLPYITLKGRSFYRG